MSEHKNDPARTQLIVGVLGFVGVLLAALLGVFAPVIQERLKQSNLPTPTPIVIIASPVPTDTVPPGEPTSTPAPTDTPTPEPSLTPTPVPLEAGADWQEDCISVVWKVIPESGSAAPNGNCYAEPLAGALSVRNQKLEIFYNDRASTDQVAGIFVEIPSDALVEFTTHLENIQSGELWTGIFVEPKIDTSGVAVGAPAGKMDNSAFVIHKMPGDDRYTTGKTRKDSGDYLFSFDVSPTSVTVLLEKYTTLDTVPVSSTNSTRWLFIGYKVIAGQTNLISGTVSGLKITPR
jgi:hypothetical protein